MTGADVAVVEHGSALALSPDQAAWNEQQLVALRHIGVESASEGDLMVFHHVCQRTGLDPFARQIHMIGRRTREKVDGEWQSVVKQTIQTGIDGFRLIGRRAANRSGHKVSVSAPMWAHEDGTWREVWQKAWGYPIAAKVTITRDGEPFTAVAMFEEYAQTKAGGDVTQMWQQRRAGQLAKCAEALAWRMAFPQDLAGLYTDDEMGQADNHTAEQTQPAPGRGGIADALRDPEPETVVGEVVEEQAPASDVAAGPQLDAMFERLDAIGKTSPPDRMAYVTEVLGRAIKKPADLTADDVTRVIDAVEATLDQPFPDTTNKQDGADA